MNISRFFIGRPIFACVLSLLILLLGLIALKFLPVTEYPEVVPPTVIVRATYPGANPKTIAETVSSPLEQVITGVENGIYMSSQATTDGVMTLTVTFKLGTDLDKAQVQVQNRVAQALPKLPTEVQRLGVTTLKSSPDLTMVVHLFSPTGVYDDIYVRNYATLQVKDVLARLPGVGQVQIFGSGDYAMRIWLNPEKLEARGLTAADVITAITEQNAQVAAGGIGQQPQRSGSELALTINANGRLIDEAEFSHIVIKTGANGENVLLEDVARTELGASDYSLRSLLNNRAAVALPIFQLPGSNAIELSDNVRKAMAELKKSFPEGLDYSVVYDPTVFVRHSIEAVVHTLFEALILVVIVVIVFLQTWRASIIPLAAVPVSLVGTFAVMLALGFSINALSLFGLVLAIGIVVDDAIVVVENVERNIHLGLSPRDATNQAMKEVTGPIIATALVLCAVFIPTAFISGLTGQFYRQFALTIAISTVISAFNSLTLSPALCAILLRPAHAPEDRLTRTLNFLLGWFFRPFNRVFRWSSNFYSKIVQSLLRRTVVALVVYAGLLAFTFYLFQNTPSGFVPLQDKQYLVAFAQLPDAASLDRTDKVIRQMSDIALHHPAVESAVAFPGLSINGFTNSTNSGIVFVTLKPFEERQTADLSGNAVARQLQQSFGSIQSAFIAIFPPPPVQGLGTIGGFRIQLEDRAGLGYEEVNRVTQEVLKRAAGTPELSNLFTSFTVNVPQLQADIDVEKAATLGLSKTDIANALQVNLGSLYVNDFNRFGRTYQVIAQADEEFRKKPSDLLTLKVRNKRGQLVPLGSVVKVSDSSGPDRAEHYNSYLTAPINGAPGKGYSSGQAEAAMTRIVSETLPKGMSVEWTELAYQKVIAGNTAIYIFPLCVLLVFLVLAAQYENLRLPLAVVLIVPLCLLFALVGVHIDGGDNNVFTQIAFIVLIGLACKNAILIVEFAKTKNQEEHLPPAQAALVACQLRLRPILMTSTAFIAGVWPLVASRGAGAEMRHAMGIATFAGMIGVTVFGLFLTPIFYVLISNLGRKQPKPAKESGPVVKTPPQRSNLLAEMAKKA
ncbi:MAG TPA: multidrug efflux RND transporter permease subunit [Chthoniobacterales bacterium]|nr:multidrug efflux RND transporter permease subunit [Chthoniobacterales bacterium]